MITVVWRLRSTSWNVTAGHKGYHPLKVGQESQPNTLASSCRWHLATEIRGHGQVPSYQANQSSWRAQETASATCSAWRLHNRRLEPTGRAVNHQVGEVDQHWWWQQDIGRGSPHNQADLKLKNLTASMILTHIKGRGLNLGGGEFFMCSGHLLNSKWPIDQLLGRPCFTGQSQRCYQMHVGTRTYNKKTLRWHQDWAPRHPNVSQHSPCPHPQERHIGVIYFYYTINVATKNTFKDIQHRRYERVHNVCS